MVQFIADLPPHTVYGICVGTLGILFLLAVRLEWIAEDERRGMGK